MSLTLIKGAFMSAMRDLPQHERDDRWMALESNLVNTSAGNTVHVYVPLKVRDISFERRQGELFAEYRDAGFSIREIAAKTNCAKSSVHSRLSIDRTVSRTAA